MNADDHAALIEINNRLAWVRAQQEAAERAGDHARLHAMQAEIDKAAALRTELLRRTEPEDEPGGG
jgi:hypothetical protein